MVRRYQRTVPDGCAISKHTGTVDGCLDGKLEAIGRMRSRRQRSLRPWINGRINDSIAYGLFAAEVAALSDRGCGRFYLGAVSSM